jgi:hypothetical protein
MRLLPSSAPAALLLAAALFVSAAGGAVAGSQVTGADIKNGSVTAKDLSPSTKKALRGLTRFTTVTEVSDTVPDGDDVFLAAECPGGRTVLGSVAFWNNQHTVVETFSTSLRVMTAYGANDSGSGDTVVLRVTCAATD